MAEINSAAADNRKAGVRRSKKLSTRIDLTPMVDLGFLLITFFIFTTTMSEPKALQLIMPADGPGSESGESATLTIIPTVNNRVFYYHGQLENALQKGQFGYTGYSFSDGVGDIIRQKQKAMNRVRPGYQKELTLIIKPAYASSYQNVVSMLDEVLINAVPRYVLTDITKEETVTFEKKNIQL
ncbi:MAG: biopolymer transporter ExbD [Chitinophagaceae bacterium]